jgi:hypothetical protein
MKSNSTKPLTSADFTTWGPDFRSQEAFRTTGTFHIQGPVLVQNSQYGIKVSILAKDNRILSPPLGDVFALPAKK